MALEVIQEQPELKLLLEDHFTLEQPRSRWAAAGSVLTHLLIGVLISLVPWGPAGNAPLPRMFYQLRAIPLFSPPKQLTQKAPQTGPVSHEVNLPGLLAPPIPPPPTPPGATQAAASREFQAPPAAAPPAPKPLIEAPKLDERREIAELQARNIPGLGTPQVAPPVIQTEERPKLTFERPGGMSGTTATGGVAKGAVPLPPKATVEDSLREIVRGGSGRLTVGDLGEGIGGLGEALNNPNMPTRNASAIELLSDPLGADFKPYLIRILSSVRRNWVAVLPESARLGRRGKVQIQFAINKDGSVPKLVIALPSGADALDRAAVAGISASNPFPPLPDEFKGGQVRLQFTFLYNISAR